MLSAQSLQKGIDLFKANKLNEAKIELKQFLKQDPENKKANEYLGDIFFKQQKWSESASCFKTLVKKDAKNAVYHYKYAGAIGLQAKNNRLKALFLIDDIKFHFEKAAELAPDFVDARLALVQLYVELPTVLGGSIDKAKKHAKELKLLDSKAYENAINYINKAS